MSGSQVRQIRASSARPAQIRPNSSKNRKLHQKTQFIDSVYGQNNHNHHSSQYNSFQKHKLFNTKFHIIQPQAEDVSKLIPKAQQLNKQRQQLFEQNLHLKKQLNKVRDQLNKKKTKIQMLSQKNNKYTKQFNRQFQKKIYWTGNNSYLISGVKAQYQKLKEEFNQKFQQCQILKRQLIQSKAPEFKIYAQTLQEQNKKLLERINKMTEVSQKMLFDNQDDQDRKSVPDYIYNQLYNKLQKVDEKLKQSQLEGKIYKQQNKDLQKKIQFIEKLLIQKDNGQHHANKKAKKLQKQKIQIQQRIKQLILQKEDCLKNYETNIFKLKAIQEKRFKTQKDIFDRTLQQKDTRIQKLQKQIAYLSTLLTYWKPLDQLNRDQIQKNYQDQYQSTNNKQLQKKKKAQQINFRTQSKNGDIAPKSRRITEHELKGGDFVLKTSIENVSVLKQNTKTQRIIKNRVPQTADKKHRQEAQKKRKVDYKEVQHLGQHLRYRFLGLRLQVNQIKKYFDYKKNLPNPENNFLLSSNNIPETTQNTAWQQQYITMGQAKQTLMQQPFQLQEEQAEILARYMIEDSPTEFVYVDLLNQNKRTVVKSIIKALVGNYQILQGERQLKVQNQCKQMLDKYQGNLLSALSTMAASGFTSRKKFIQLLNSLGIQLSQQGKDFLVCKMLLKSQSLNKLSYMIIL